MAEKKDYAETLFQAMDLLINKKIESVKFDETITATITDASKSSTGQYTVTTGNAKFVAYSTETGYRVNDSVMITIPQGNYDNQKIIIGKAVDNMNTPMIYKSPFQQLINVSNNLIPGHIETGFWANYTSSEQGRCWDINETDFKDAIVYKDSICLWDSEDIYEQGFTRFGLQAQFSIWLSEYGTAYGNYGLAVELTFKCVDLAENNTFKNIFTFDSNEFFGDVYNFETYYTQENIYDISDFINYPIVRIRLFAYQRNNFEDVTKSRIYEAPNEGEFSTINPNIFVKDPYICLGMAAEDFSRDTLNIMTNSSLTYKKSFDHYEYQEVTQLSNSIETYYVIDEEEGYKATSLEAEGIAPDATYNTEQGGFPIENNGETTYLQLYQRIERFAADRDYDNTKIVGARWIHKDIKTDTIATVQNNELPDNYEVRWYRYKLGAPSPDEFSGAHWERFYGCKNQPDTENWEYAITEEEILGGAEDLATNNLEIVFIPNVNHQTEVLKAIILKDEGYIDGTPIWRLIATSNLLEFINDDDVRDEATLIDANALSIRYDDDEKGHYFLYNEAGDIGKNEDSEVRTLTAVFDEETDNVYEKSELIKEECHSIIWTFPDVNANTMIIPMTGTGPDAIPATADKDGKFIFTNTIQVGFTIKKHLNNTATQNTITLEIVKDGLRYFAQVQPVFGTAGTNGSDYTLILTWLDGKNAIDIGEDLPELNGELALYDQAGNTVEWPEDAEVHYNWYVAEVEGTSDTKLKIQEENDVFYPILTNNDYALLTCYDDQYRGPNKDINPEIEDQPIGFYYFTESEIINTEDKYFFDLEEKCFKPYADAIDPAEIGQWYAKGKKNKLEFRTVHLTVDPLNQEDGTVQYGKPTQDNFDYPDHYAIHIVEKSANSGTYIKEYYYSKQQRYFIKYDDRFILDPWSDYQEAETYYEPIEEKGIKYKVYDNNNQMIAGILDISPGAYHHITEDEFDINTNYYNKNDYTNTYTETSPTGYNSNLYTYENNDRKVRIYKYRPGDMTEQVSMNSLFILQITLTNFGDYDLVTYYPVPIKKNLYETVENQEELQVTRIVDYIEGPDRVRYSSAGEVDYNKNPYGIVVRKLEGEEENRNFVTYKHNQNNRVTKDFYQKIASDTEYEETEEVYIQVEENVYELIVGEKPEWSNEDEYFKHIYETDGKPLEGYWRLLLLDTEDPFRPKLNETVVIDSTTGKPKEPPGIDANGNNGQYDVPLLSPSSVYIPQSLPYGVQFIETSGPTPEILWTQPILVYENKYPSRTLNKWNGRDILTDEDTGTIVANGLAAGKKERDNTFTGVVLGDWSRSIADTAITKQTGIYGFNQGAMSYAFKDDGTGFIGKDGKGRIYLDGDKSQIFSSNWVNNFDPSGMLLDIDDGFIKMQSQHEVIIPLNGVQATYEIDTNNRTNLYYLSGNNYVLNDGSGFDANKNYYIISQQGENKYITLGVNQPTYPLSVGLDKNIANRKFRVAWDGTAYIQNGYFEGVIASSEVSTTYLYAANGYIGGWKIEATQLSSNNGAITFNSSDGSLRGASIYTQSGEIGGWKINQTSLTGGKTTLDSANGITTNAITINDGVQGKIGHFQGNDGSGATEVLGIQETTSHGIVLETSSNIRLSAAGGGNCNAIYLKSNSIRFTAPADQQYGIYARFA